MRVRYYVFLSDEFLLTWLYENGNRPNKVSAMFQLIYTSIYRIHTVPGF